LAGRDETGSVAGIGDCKNAGTIAEVPPGFSGKFGSRRSALSLFERPATPLSGREPMPRADRKNATRSRCRIVLLRVCAVLLGLLLASLAAEGGLRLAGIDQSYLTPLGSFFEPDAELGFRGRPDFSGRFRQSDFDVRVVHDANGFRKHEHVPDQRPAPRNVFVLGDSFTWGYGVAQGCVFTDLLQDRLSDCHVRNFALCASGTVQQRAIFERHVSPAMKPGDVVVLAFYANDFSDNAGHCVAFPRLYAELRDGAIQEVQPRQLRLATLKKFAKDSSCLVNLFANCWERFREPRVAAEPPSPGRPEIEPASAPARMANEAETGQPLTGTGSGDPERSAAGCNKPEMKITVHYLRAIHKSCHRSGARFLVVYIPDPSEFGEHVGSRVAELAAERQALLVHARELGIDTLDLLPVLLRVKARDRELRLTFPGDFHWNTRGHEIAAAEISRAVQGASPLAKNE
jgi:hypothetical protein